MASLEEATIQRRVFAWQGADTEPLTGTEADSPGAGWTITRDDVVVLIEQLRNAAGAVVAFVELQGDGKRTTHRGWVDQASRPRTRRSTGCSARSTGLTASLAWAATEATTP